MSCSVGHRCGSDPLLLWLWRRLAAPALIGPLAWELPYAMDTALKKKRQKKISNNHNTFKKRLNHVGTTGKPITGPFYLFIYFNLFFYFFVFLPFCRAALVAYEGSQARGPTGAVATGLCHSHSNARSEPCLRPTP